MRGQDATAFFYSVKLANSLKPGAPGKAGRPRVSEKSRVAGLPAPPRPIHLSPLGPRPGYIIGRAVFADGRPIPQFSVWAVGFDGQVNLFPGSVPTVGVAEARNGRYAMQTRDSFRHTKPVRATVVGVHAVAKIPYRNNNYLLEMYPLDGKTNGTDKGDFRGDSGKGIVRDFVLKISGLRLGYTVNEDTEVRYRGAYYGGVLPLDGTVSQKEGRNFEDETSFSRALTEGDVEVTLTPEGRLLDGSTGRTIRTLVPVAVFKLGGNWHSRYLRNIPLGVYTATARLVLPGGETRPLKVRGDIRPSFPWVPSLTVTWIPAAYAGSLPDQLSGPTLYIGQ